MLGQIFESAYNVFGVARRYGNTLWESQLRLQLLARSHYYRGYEQSKERHVTLRKAPFTLLGCCAISIAQKAMGDTRVCLSSTGAVGLPQPGVYPIRSLRESLARFGSQEDTSDEWPLVADTYQGRPVADYL
jgi:hypothetical protein